MDTLQTIRQLPLFRAVSEAALKEFGSKCIERKFNAGQMIYFRGGEEDKTYLLFSGEVKLYRSAEGQKIVMQTIQPGGFFGDLSFARHPEMLPPDTYTQAEKDSVVCIINPLDLQDVIMKYPEFAMTLLVSLRDRMHHAESKIKDLATASASTRIINELIRYSIRHGSFNQGFYEVEDKLTHQALADMTGVTRETVTKTLQQLQANGLIQYTSNKLFRLNREKILNECVQCLKVDETEN